MSVVKSFLELNEAEKKLVLKWRNHPEIRSRMFSSHEISWQEHLNFIESLHTNPTAKYWMVTGKGIISLRKIDTRNGNAYLGIYKDPSNTEKGAARELMKILLGIAFEGLKLHTLKLEVFSDNVRAVNFYNKCGFNQEGRLREFLKRDNGVYEDLILMGITENEFRSSDSDIVN